MPVHVPFKNIYKSTHLNIYLKYILKCFQFNGHLVEKKITRRRSYTDDTVKKLSKYKLMYGKLICLKIKKQIFYMYNALDSTIIIIIYNRPVCSNGK